MFVAHAMRTQVSLLLNLGAVFDERSESGLTDYPLASITMQRGVIPRDEVGRKDSSSEDKSKYRRIMPGDIGYNTMRMWRRKRPCQMEAIVSPAYTICVPKRENHLIGQLSCSKTNV